MFLLGWLVKIKGIAAEEPGGLLTGAKVMRFLLSCYLFELHLGLMETGLSFDSSSETWVSYFR